MCSFNTNAAEVRTGLSPIQNTAHNSEMILKRYWLNVKSGEGVLMMPGLFRDPASAEAHCRTPQKSNFVILRIRSYKAPCN